MTSAIGEIVLEQRPERVVMATSWDADLFAALGVTPVGTDEQLSFYPWAEEALPGEIETIWPVGDTAYPLEEIAATTPDLIVDSFALEADTVTDLESIAPVLGAPDTGTEEAPWQDRLLLLGEALDLSDRAQQVIDDYDAAFETIRQEHPEFAGKTVDLLVAWGGEAGVGYISSTGSEPEQLLTQLGFSPNPSADRFVDDDVVSNELLGTLDGDVLVISNQFGDPAAWDAYISNPLFQGLESVQNDRLVVLTTEEDGSITYNGEPADFSGHFGRAFSVGPLSQLELANLLTPLIANVLN